MKNYLSKIIGILIVTVVLFQTNLSIAATMEDLKNEKADNQQEIENKEQEKEEIQAKKSETIKEIEEITSQIESYENQINDLTTKIDSLNNEIKETEEKLTKAQEDYDKQEKLLEERLVVTYEAGQTSFLDILLSSDSITKLISNYYLVSEIATNDTELLDKIQKEKQEIEEMKISLENNKKELDTSKAEKQGIATQLQNSKSEKDKYVAQLTEDEKAIQDQIDSINAINKELDAEILKKQKEIEDQLNQQRPSGGGGSSGGSSTGGGPTSSSGFINPVPSAYAKVTTGLYYSDGRYHGAVDFGTGGINGQPVYAVADGIVHTAKALNYSYGNYIIIAHYNGLYTLYAHGQAGSIRVSEGQIVKQGQQIMNVGNTGNSFGAHLHFEVRVSPGTYDCRRNPYNYLP